MLKNNFNIYSFYIDIQKSQLIVFVF